MATPMTNYTALPPSVLAKAAQIEHGCLTLSTKLEGSRRELQRLRVEQRDLAPRVVHDEYEANRESERLIAEAQRLNDAISAQTATCERLERRLRVEERTVAGCKTFLHELPAGARLRVVEGQAGDLDGIRAQIAQTRDEIGALQRLPVPSDGLSDRVKAYVHELAARARPVIQGIGDGQSLRVLWPLTADANRISLSGFVQHEGNALLLLAHGSQGEVHRARLSARRCPRPPDPK